jgi:AraC family transcriptional regulator
MDAVAAAHKIENGHHVPRDWVRIETSLNHAIESYTTEASLAFDGGWTEVRRYRLSGPAESVWTTSNWSYFFDISLGPKPAGANSLLGLEGGDPPRALSRIMMVPPGQGVRSCSSGGRLRSMRCVLDARWIDGLLGRRAEWDPPLVRKALRLSGGKIEWLLHGIYQEVHQAGYAATALVEAFARALSVELIRQFQLNRGQEREQVGGLAPWRMRLLHERIRSDEVPPSLVELAALCGMSVRHLNRAFKAATGQTIGRFVKAATIERARTLLVETDEPIGAIARRLGFATSGTFAHAFRQATGLLPGQVAGRSPNTIRTRTRRP